MHFLKRSHDVQLNVKPLITLHTERQASIGEVKQFAKFIRQTISQSQSHFLAFLGENATQHQVMASIPRVHMNWCIVLG